MPCQIKFGLPRPLQTRSISPYIGFLGGRPHTKTASAPFGGPEGQRGGTTRTNSFACVSLREPALTRSPPPPAHFLTARLPGRSPSSADDQGHIRDGLLEGCGPLLRGGFLPIHRLTYCVFSPRSIYPKVSAVRRLSGFLAAGTHRDEQRCVGRCDGRTTSRVRRHLARARWRLRR